MNWIISFKQFYLIILFFSFSLIAKETWLNIFVHGTIGLKSSASLGLFFHLLKDKVENTKYSKYVNCLRHSPRIFSEQAIQNLGLQKVDLNNPYFYRGAYIFSLLFKNFLDKYSSDNDSNNIFYTYGWSGLLSYKTRFKESIKLYKSLSLEINKLKAQNKNLKIRIIGYSHGGNIALNLAAVHDYYFSQDNFIIDELINIGTPVQSANSNLIFSSIFKKIYNIFSYGDPYQALDIFAPRSWYSHKKFKKYYHCGILPKKLTQIGLSFEISKYLRYRKNINWHPKPYCFCNSTLLPIKAGHFELWLFGWNKKFYNQCFPLNPLPIAVFIPLLLYWTKRYTGNLINIKILPDHEIGILNVKNGPKNIVKPFVSRYQLNYLQKWTLKHKPYECISNLINYNL